MKVSRAKKIRLAFAQKVCGLTIRQCTYHDDGETAFPVIELSDGSCILIQGDDECNGAGVPVFYGSDDSEIVWFNVASGGEA